MGLVSVNVGNSAHSDLEDNGSILILLISKSVEYSNYSKEPKTTCSKGGHRKEKPESKLGKAGLSNNITQVIINYSILMVYKNREMAMIIVVYRHYHAYTLP